MLLVETYIDRSPINGIGLFTKSHIMAGEIVWLNGTDSELILTQEQFDQKSEYLKHLYRHYGYKSKDWHLPLDNSRFMNHSVRPNLSEDMYGNYVAVIDLPPYTELTCNYSMFDTGEGCGNFIQTFAG